MRNRLAPNRVQLSLTAFLKSFKKGSQSIRRIFTSDRNEKIKAREINTVRTFFQLINTETAPEACVRSFLAFWGFNFITNRQREFSFRFYNNTLGINSGLSHFVQNVNPGCAFCIANHENVIPSETFLHLFYECSHTNNIITAMSLVLIPELNFPTETTRKLFWFCGINPNHPGPCVCKYDTNIGAHL